MNHSLRRSQQPSTGFSSGNFGRKYQTSSSVSSSLRTHATEQPVEFLQTAALLEATGAGAYAGAAPLIEDADLIPPALSIHSVEARHTSFQNVLNGEIGFPNAFDEALTVDEVLARAGPFIIE